jgi:trimethylamine---corrinoid protein Co-methyltransferase
MLGQKFSFFNPFQIDMLRDKVLELLQVQGVKLDPHPQMFKALTDAGANVDPSAGIVRFPKPVMERLVEQAPKKFSLGARHPDAVLELPRPDRTFYSRTNTGGHGWIEPDTQSYRKVTSADLAGWARLVTELSEISFIAFLFCNDVPVQTADVHGLGILLKNTPKHAWVQPYSAGSVEHLIRLGEAAAGGRTALANNPVISMIACSLSPKSFKHMDLEIIYRSAKASLPSGGDRAGNDGWSNPAGGRRDPCHGGHGAGGSRGDARRGLPDHFFNRHAHRAQPAIKRRGFQGGLRSGPVHKGGFWPAYP